ncbi:amidohydrolase family protein [Maricaulis virginensis]|uniref:Amidohydrolase n=1 Tax=Maricaulis virginensis TaxID=144022 RepID=A0A9W6IMT9_9PROT|nr:amidohydrolase family protein [Maricaulis virginensis]GLK52429.1 amidohydrolase [Maricaulis virginensis]
MKQLISVLAASVALAAPAAAQTYAVTNGRVVTNTDAGILENATVIVRDGDIVAVGAGAEIPEDATVIDASGNWVTPGVFAAFSQLGLIEVALEGSTTDDSAGESPFSVALDVADGFNPAGTYLATNRMEGVTRAAIFPSTGHNIFAGQGALIDTSGDAGSLFQAGSFVFADLSESGAGRAGGSRPAAWAFLEAALADARGYPGRFSGDHEGDALNRYDAAALLPVARGRVPLVMAVNRAADIRRAIRFKADNAPIQLILVGAAEGWMVAEELADADIPVIVDPLEDLPSSFDSLGASLQNAARLQDAGVDVAYSTAPTADGYFNARLVPQHAGNAVANGVPWDEAFRAITLTPAEIYGVGDRYGALAPGYAGDVVVWDGDPLEVMSAPVAVLIDGEPTALESRQTQLRDRYINITDDTPFAYRR